MSRVRLRLARAAARQRIWERGARSVHWIIACVRGFVVPAVALFRIPGAAWKNTEQLDRTDVKVNPSVKPICEKCKVIRRNGRVMVICDNLRHKQRQG